VLRGHAAAKTCVRWTSFLPDVGIPLEIDGLDDVEE
jgi:hypothetical protein